MRGECFFLILFTMRVERIMQINKAITVMMTARIIIRSSLEFGVGVLGGLELLFVVGGSADVMSVTVVVCDVGLIVVVTVVGVLGHVVDVGVITFEHPDTCISSLPS